MYSAATPEEPASRTSSIRQRALVSMAAGNFRMSSQDVQRHKQGPFIPICLLGSVDSGLWLHHLLSCEIPEDSSPILSQGDGVGWGE